MDFFDKKIENNFNKIFNVDCMKIMVGIKDDIIDLTLTDIPYEFVNKKNNTLRETDKGKANEKTFELIPFVKEIFRITKGSGYIFCGKEQVSDIFSFFNQSGVSTRLMTWEKTNPSPMNCQYLWMSGVECFVYFKKPKATFNEKYKNSVLRFPNGSSKIHPTEKPIKLFEYLIKTSSNENDLVFDPCIGSGTTAVCCQNLNRKFIGFEINKEYYNVCLKRINDNKKRGLF